MARTAKRGMISPGPPTAEDQQDFLHRVESGMSVGHLGGSSPLPTDAPPQPAARSSSRLSDKFGHVQGVCRCQRPLIHTGQARASARASPKSRRVHAILNPFSCEQDESIFKAYQKSSYQWVVHGGSSACERRPMAPARWCLACVQGSEE